MARLWINHKTDKGGAGHGGSEWASAEIRWGSPKDSKIAVEVQVSWVKGEEFPFVRVINGNPRLDIKAGENVRVLRAKEFGENDE